MNQQSNQDPLTWEQFQHVDMRVGTILSAEHFPEAHKPAYLCQIDFGSLGIKQSSAQLTEKYQPQELIGKQVIAIVNFPPQTNCT